MEVEPLNETQLEDSGLNTCNHDIPLSSREVPSFDEPTPQPNPLPNCPPLDTSLGDKRGSEPPIKPHSSDSFRMKVVDNLTIHTPPLPHEASFHPKDIYCYYHPCIDDPKKYYVFKPGLLGSLTKSFSNLMVIEDDFLGERISLEKGRIKETHHLEHIIQQPLFQNRASSYHNVITEYLVNISKRRAFWSLNEDILKITILKTNTPYPSRKIRRIRAYTHQRPQRKQVQYAISRKGYTSYSSYMGIKYSERYQTWSLLQETLIRRTVFEEPPYPFNYPTRRLTMKEMLAKFINEGRREHKEMEIFIKEFRTTNELLLKKQSNLLSELEIKENELSKVVSNFLIPKNKVKGVTTRGGNMTSEATRSKESNETGFNKDEPPRFEQDVQEKPHDEGVENKSSSI
ncbi:hypothetical protein Tco_0877365, partial [Tanacetum coccineum]